ncbi:MAG TPA: PEP/pyruvate-binding domain-containing protein, partial [bacterium]|nr:PEP/pyruvate-binding domain-containing protein [bacterium]
YIKSPLAVRSSGLFEDSLSQPFAGIYETYFLPNNHPDINVRLAQLLDAVKMVYASVFTPLAKSYFDSVNHSLEEEKMAVIIQELVGNSYGDHFYPHISGVAQSYNYYPFSHMKPEDGLGLLAAGLGKSIVDGSQSFRFCPKFPKMNVMTAKDLLQNSQRYIYGLNIKNNQLHLENGDEATLEKIGIDIAEKHGSLNLCASVYDNDSNSIKPGLHAPGPRIIDFRYILHYDIVPLANAVTTILDVMKSALGTPVEIEFSVDLNKDESGKCSLYILQVKPLIRTMENIEVSTDAVDKKDILLYTTRGMGNGVIEGIKDLVYVIPEKFDKMKTRLIQKEVAGINNEMKKNGLQYILMGPGRWGSSDPFLGIPVDWAAISQAKVIVEAGLKDFNVDASLGSHFFHNITSMNIGYFTVPAKSSDSYIDFEHLKSMEPHNETEFLRHIRFETPLTVIMDGKRSVSIITKEHWK